ncbi:MAG: DUF5667 domain-containing protein [Syntrophales bacterium]
MIKSDKDLIEKIQGLKQIQPSPVWVDFCRSYIEQRIDIKEQIKQINNNSVEPEHSHSSIFDSFFFRKLAPAMALSLFFVISSVGLIYGAKNSLPGDLLFSVKINADKIRLALTPKREQAKLQIEITNSRLEELDKLVTNNQSKEGAIMEAVKMVNKELVVVKKQIAQMGEMNKLDEVAKMAKTAVEITNKMSVLNASIIGSSCASFASSSCVVYFDENKQIEGQQELPAIQTLKMAQEIIDNINELSKKESSQDSGQISE